MKMKLKKCNCSKCNCIWGKRSRAKEEYKNALRESPEYKRMAAGLDEKENLLMDLIVKDYYKFTPEKRMEFLRWINDSLVEHGISNVRFSAVEVISPYDGLPINTMGVSNSIDDLLYYLISMFKICGYHVDQNK